MGRSERYKGSFLRKDKDWSKPETITANWALQESVTAQDIAFWNYHIVGLCYLLDLAHEIHCGVFDHYSLDRLTLVKHRVHDWSQVPMVNAFRTCLNGLNSEVDYYCKLVFESSLESCIESVRLKSIGDIECLNEPTRLTLQFLEDRYNNR